MSRKKRCSPAHATGEPKSPSSIAGQIFMRESITINFLWHEGLLAAYGCTFRVVAKDAGIGSVHRGCGSANFDLYPASRIYN
jgi:hypothetical protein